ncbi:hypothetical protein D9M72_453800 [compost metagenome]
MAFTIGTPIVSAIALAFTTGNYADPSTADAILGGVHFGLLVNALVILAAAALILIFLPTKKTSPAEPELAAAEAV